MEITSALWVALLITVVPLLGWWNEIWHTLSIRLRRNANGATLPPGNMGVPFFGEMMAFLWYFNIARRPDDYIHAKRHKYGDGSGLYRTHLFGSPTIIVVSPQANKFVFQSESSFGLKWPSLEIVGEKSLVAVEGASHTRVRSVVVKATNQPDALRHIAVMVQPRIIAALEVWAHKSRVTVFREVKKVTFANIGKYFANFEPGPVLDDLDRLFEGLVNGFRAYPLNFPGTTFRHAVQCRKKISATFMEEINVRKKRESPSEGYDLLEGLMNISDENGTLLSDTEVLDNIVSLVVAGYTSTSLAIMWAVYYLAKYPDVLSRLREEHLTIIKKTPGDIVTYDQIVKLSYTTKVVEEVIRLANIAAFIFRTAKNDVEYKGNIIPKGWNVICWVRYLHENPENFDDPLSFNPDRWKAPAKPGTYLVFGGGSRICAGNMLARLQVGLFLHHLVVGYKWKLVNPEAGMSYLSHPKPEDEVEIDICKLNE